MNDFNNRFFNTNYINPQEFNRIMQENYKYEMN